MTKRVKVVTLACVTVLCCLALIIGGTYALFSGKTGITNHLQAGELKIELGRNKLESTMLNANGLLETMTNTTAKDFTNPTEDNLFDVAEGTKVAPGCAFVADLVLKNKGDVAVNWYIEIDMDEDSDQAFAEQLRLTLTVGQEEKTCLLSELVNLTVGSETSPLGQLALNSEAGFSVKIEFVDLANNNDAQMQEVTFDLIVHAIQAVA